MAIQFHCPGCSQPIEVDDIYRSQTAACPYCRRVVNVPAESALERERPAAARPLGRGEGAGSVSPEASPEVSPPPPPPPPGELHVGPVSSHRERAARSLGHYALICTILVVLLFAGVFAYSVSQLALEFMQSPASQPSAERMAEIQERLSANPWLGAAQIGIAFFALAGTALAIASLVQSRRNNWRALVSLVICALFVLCVCGGTLIAVAGGSLAPPA